MPIFRRYAISLDYYDETIAFFDKDMNSPVVPGGDGSGGGSDSGSGKDKLSGGVIFAIIFSVFVVIAGMGGISYYCKKQREGTPQASHNDIITAIERGSFVNPRQDVNMT